VSRTRLVGIALVVVAGLGLALGATARAEQSTYVLRARADALGIEFLAKDAPVVSIGGGQVAFITPASAQSALDALGTSASFASAPFPGDLVVGLPGLVNGFTGGQIPPLPNYPLYVASSYPTAPEGRQATGPYLIEAKSAADRSDAQARVGLSTTPPQVAAASGVTAVSRDPATGKLSAVATADVAPFSLEGILQVGEVKSVASVEFDPNRPGATPVKKSSLSVGTITVAGVRVGLTEKGLTVADSVVPVDVSALSAALKQAGIRLEYVPGVETPTSVTSASIRVSTEQTLPSAGRVGVGFVLGQVSANADPGSVLGAAGGAASGTAPAGAGGLGDVAVPAVSPGSTQSAPLGVGGALTGAPTVGAVPRRFGGNAAGGQAVPAGAVRPISQPALWSLFVVLVVGALAALGGSRSSAGWSALYRRLAPGP